MLLAHYFIYFTNWPSNSDLLLNKSLLELIHFLNKVKTLFILLELHKKLSELTNASSKMQMLAFGDLP